MKQAVRAALVIRLMLSSLMVVALTLSPLMVPVHAKEKRVGKPLVAMVQSTAFYYERARAEIRHGRHAEAIVDLDCALMLAPNNYELLLAKAFELNRMARFVESEKIRCLAVFRNGGRSPLRWTEIVLQKSNQKNIRL